MQITWILRLINMRNANLHKLEHTIKKKNRQYKQINLINNCAK